MHISTILGPLGFILSNVIAFPTEATQPLLHKRAYTYGFLSHVAGMYRFGTSVAPACNGADCPVLTPEETLCQESRYKLENFIKFPPDPLRANKSDTATTNVEICSYYPPVDLRCMKHGVSRESALGLPKYLLEDQMNKYGIAGCPATPEQVLKRVMVQQSKWGEEKARRMLDIVAPGWEDETKDPEELPVRRGKEVLVDDRENPFHLPGWVSVRVLPNGPIQKAILDCEEWMVARRGDTCTNIAKRMGVTREQFMERNPVVVDKEAKNMGKLECRYLWAGYSYCVPDRPML
ncbi:hypothetical protein BJ508DRAFT_413854 [Ascobolus immersus RN42]|uniref:LysM domain-containing protein n=1 Tax=Ascobolus immersus RN42 TaxID=1160509 RepID=A0A3N4IA51_ASCIM|nr:hypothetical protein BJ508DRAFT_413854 [Ascobolus immersus RN42]